MLKVAKFGGSSMADAGQYRKVKDIILADRERRVVIVSAAGKRFSGDYKITATVSGENAIYADRAIAVHFADNVVDA